MNQTDLIARVRRNAFIRDNHPDYTDAIILDELNDALRSIYEGLVTIPRQGHWLKQTLFQSTVNQMTVRIPPRSVVGGLEKVEIGEINNQLYALDEVTENHAQWYETFGGKTGVPQYYVIRGDQIDFLPSFDRVMNVRLSYYIKPSLLVAAQTTALIGRILTVSPSPTIPQVGYSGAGPQPFIRTGLNAGTQVVTGSVIDIVHSDGTCEVVLTNLVVGTATASVCLFPAGTDLTEVVVGDYVRGTGETDWPPLPEEFHRTVADTAAVKIMLQLNMTTKASVLASSAGGDLERLSTLMSIPRTRRQPKRVPLSMIIFGSGRRSYARFP